MSSSYLSSLVERVRSLHVATLSALGIAIFVPFAINDYRTYMSYGPGGLPYNVKGWLMANLARLVSAEQFSTSVYSDPSLPLAKEPPFLQASFPPSRALSRPKIGSHPVPQRQLEQLPTETVRQKLIERFNLLGERTREKGLIEIKQSRFERQHNAFFVSPTHPWNAIAQETGGEIAHVHAGLDGSIHVLLHPSDCKAVIEAGWAQRHGFSGVRVLKKIAGFSLPVNYILVYAPRNEAEIDIAMAIVKASIGFMADSREQLE
jgi:hypothetical protein